MAKYLITQTLLSSWNYLFECADGCEADAEAEFLAALKKETLPRSEDQEEAINNGLDFEKAVYAVANGKKPQANPKWERGIRTVAEIIRGSQIQVRISREIEVAGMTFIIHGVLDALRAGIIYDVKFRNTSFHSGDIAGKYLNSPQHPFYFYLVPEAREFIYLVSDGDDLYTERYTPEETPPAKLHISGFVDYLNTAGLMETYKAIWRAKE